MAWTVAIGLDTHNVARAEIGAKDSLRQLAERVAARMRLRSGRRSEVRCGCGDAPWPADRGAA